MEELEVLQRQWHSRLLSPEEMKRALRKLLFKYHPDRNLRDRKVAEERTRLLLDWYRDVNTVPRPGSAEPTEESFARPTPPAPTPATDFQFVLFMVDGSDYGCEVKWVLGVRNVRDLRSGQGPLPRWIHDRAGVFTLDASRRTTSSSSPIESAQILLLKIDRSCKAFVVDRVDGVKTVSATDVTSQAGVRSFHHNGRSTILVRPAFFGL